MLKIRCLLAIGISIDKANTTLGAKYLKVHKKHLATTYDCLNIVYPTLYAICFCKFGFFYSGKTLTHVCVLMHS